MYTSPFQSSNILVIDAIGELTTTSIWTDNKKRWSQWYPKSLGLFLYTDYFIIFQISGFLLLLAMIGAIVLAHSDFKNPKSISPISSL